MGNIEKTSNTENWEIISIQTNYTVLKNTETNLEL